MVLTAGLRTVSISAPLTSEDQDGEAALTWCSPSHQLFVLQGFWGNSLQMPSHGKVKQVPPAAAVGLCRGRGLVRGDVDDHRVQGKAVAKGSGHRLMRAWGAHPQCKQPCV